MQRFLLTPLTDTSISFASYFQLHKVLIFINVKPFRVGGKKRLEKLPLFWGISFSCFSLCWADVVAFIRYCFFSLLLIRQKPCWGVFFPSQWLHFFQLVFSFSLWFIDVTILVQTRKDEDKGKSSHNGSGKKRKAHSFSITKASRVKQQQKKHVCFYAFEKSSWAEAPSEKIWQCFCCGDLWWPLGEKRVEELFT